MGDACKDESKWAEDIYRTHFQTLHFYHFLLSGFDRQLVIPKTFSDKLKKKLPQSATLKGPSGLTWAVELTTNDDATFFNHGWQKFVKDHSLEETDLLVFRYDGWSQFDVLIFDGKNLCEKGASNFVRRCGQTEHDNRSMDDVHTPLDVDAGCTSPVNSMGDDSVIVLSEQCINSLVSKKRTRQSARRVGRKKPAISKKRTRQSARRVGCKKPATNGEGVKSNPSYDAADSPTNKNGAQVQQYASNRRPVTEDEIKSALVLAQAASSDDTFHVVMRPTHVYKRPLLWIPTKWVMNHLLTENQEIYLRFNKGRWRAKFYYNRGRGHGGITGSGWKHFVLDNNLEQDDVCLFKPADRMDGFFVLDVSIFRVVQEITDLTV